MLSLANVSAAQAENYYEKDDYYTQGDPDLQSDSHWQGNGAEKLGLEGAVDKAVFQQLLHGKTPDGRSLHSKRINPETHRAATDYTFSAPKSVSIAALIQTDNRVIAAHDHAVTTALDVLENRYAQTRIRRGPGLRERIQTRNLIAATFRHETSREQDPQLHTHCVVINATQLENGKWQSMANEDVLRNQKLLGEIYQNELAYQLRQIGYEIAPKANGVFECQGYDDPLLNLFSTRTQQIESYIEKWEAALKAKGGNPLHAKQKEQATLATRLRKQTVPRTVLLSGWKKAITQSNIQLPQPPETAPTQIDTQAETAATAGVNHASERESLFKREKAERFALEHHLGEQTFADLQSAMTNVGLIAAKDRHTTQAAIEREQDTIAIMQSGQQTENEIATPTQVVNLTTQEQTLTSGQFNAILKTATSRDQIIAWQGVAGAGKTYSLNLLTQLAKDQGYDVSGYAPSAQAANTLNEEANIESDTVAKLLHSKGNPDSKTDQNKSPKSPLWIIDEAGLLSAKDAHALLQKAQTKNARVILVGDTRQLSAVEAGNPFKSLQKAGIQTCYLEESRRQKTAALKAAVVCLAAGEPHEGLQELDQSGLIQEIKDRSHLHRQLVLDYMSAPAEKRQQTLVLCGTNQERLDLTTELRIALQQTRSLGPDRYQLQSLRALDRTKPQLKYAAAYSEGDVVVFIRDYRRYGLKRKAQYTVIERDLAQNQVTVIGPTGERISFDPSRCGDKTTFAPQKIAIASGEQLRWTRNDSVQGVRNGQLVTVTAISADGTTTLRAGSDDDANAKEMTLSLAGQQYLDYALVSTTYSAQGKTAERVLAIADQTLSKEGLYVAVSRAKRQLSLYTTSREDLYRRAARSSANENPSDYLSLCELVKPDAENEKAACPTRIVRRVSQSERLGDRIGAVIASGHAATLRRDRSDASRAWGTERTAASLSRGIRANAADSHRAAEAASRAIERSVSRRRGQLEKAKKRRQRREVYQRYASPFSDRPAKECDLIVAGQLMEKLLDARDGRELTQDEVLRVGRVLLEGPVSRELVQSQGEAASRDYVAEVLTKAKPIVEQSQQVERHRQKSRDQGKGMER